MPRAKTVNVFTYSELTGAAKDRARNWLVEGVWEFVQDELRERFEEMLTKAGFTDAKNVYYSLGHVQGDGVTFSVKHLDLRAWLEAQGLAGTFRDLYDEDSLNVSVEERGRGFNPPRASVEPTYSPDPEGEKHIAALEEALQESVDDVCRVMKQEGYEIIAFRETDAELKDLADANGYEFDDKGRPA